MHLKSRISATVAGVALLAGTVVVPALAQQKVAPAPALAQGTLRDALVSGGMVEAGSDEHRNRIDELRAKPVPSALPSCRSITYRGSSGYISVQTNSSSLVAWGITMTPPSLAVGRWDVDTWLNGRKTSSGFHRTLTGPYIPHGSIQARRGQTFVVTATLVSANGRTYVNVPNACTVP
jgi:hypothetical protein